MRAHRRSASKFGLDTVENVESASFRRIVKDIRAETGSDSEQVAQALLRRLRTLDPDELEPFQELWEQAQAEVYRWPIRDAATLLLGPLDDDDFLAVQDWIVSHGQQVLHRVQNDPDSLVELVSDRHNARTDWFCGLPMWAHMEATGAPFAVDGPPEPDLPHGQPMDRPPVGTRNQLTPTRSAAEQFSSPLRLDRVQTPSWPPAMHQLP